MDLPNQYPYNPRLGTILVCFVCGLGEMSIGLWGFSFIWFRLWIDYLIGLLLVTFALILTVRCIWFERYLLLEIDSMLLPIGTLQMGRRTANIEYTSIRRVWKRFFYDGGFALMVETEAGTFKILPWLLPNKESCGALEEFLRQKALENGRAKKFVKELVLR